MAKARKTVSAEIAETITRLIFRERRFPPGSRLPTERDFAQQLGVSRTSIREALKLLHAAGTIEIRHGVGAFVRESPAVPHDPLGLSLCPPDPAVRFSAWLEACLAVEPPAAELAAQRAEESELAAMEDLAVQMERCLGPAEQIEEHIRQFHTALVSAAHNPILARLFQSLQDSFPLPPDETGEAFFLRQAQGCREILSFLRLRDGLGASLAARRCLLQLQTDPKEKRHGP